jgi:hypothetical protein
LEAASDRRGRIAVVPSVQWQGRTCEADRVAKLFAIAVAGYFSNCTAVEKVAVTVAGVGNALRLCCSRHREHFNRQKPDSPSSCHLFITQRLAPLSLIDSGNPSSCIDELGFPDTCFATASRELSELASLTSRRSATDIVFGPVCLRSAFNEPRAILPPYDHIANSLLRVRCCRGGRLISRHQQLSW